MQDVLMTSGALVYSGSKVLLVSHKKKDGKYGVPAGKFDPLYDRDTRDTARRELREETGLIVDMDSMVKMPKSYEARIEYGDMRGKMHRMDVYLCTKYSGSLLEETEDETPQWVEVSLVPGLRGLPNLADVVNMGMDYLDALNSYTS